MRILLVEDNTDFAHDIDDAISNIVGCELVWAKSRDSALQCLDQQPFDLVILDRKIPTQDDFLDDQTEHGWQVFTHVRDKFPGTPVWFLTATVDADFAAEVGNDHARIGDLHGRDVSEPMYLVLWKRSLTQCIQRVREFLVQRQELARIAIEGAGEELRHEETAILRMFGRRYHGAKVSWTSLNGGLSSSRVLKVQVKDATNAVLMTAAAKVASLADVNDEIRRFNNEISRLTAGGFPQRSLAIEVGAGNVGGVFYGMVGDNVESLFHRLITGHAGLARVPADLRQIQAPWYAASRTERILVSQIRRQLIRDAAMHDVRNELQGISTTAIENTSVTAARCCQHGDLHCANVVFAGHGQPMLIDFNDTGSSFGAIDPITLELSTVFHTQSRSLPNGWPSVEQMENWADGDQFVQGCSFADFLGACRAWAIADGGSPEAVLATAYAFGLRQLKYPDTNKDLARALIRGCINRLVPTATP